MEKITYEHDTNGDGLIHLENGITLWCPNEACEEWGPEKDHAYFSTEGFDAKNGHNVWCVKWDFTPEEVAEAGDDMGELPWERVDSCFQTCFAE